MSKSQNFKFDGGAGTYLGTEILAFLITILSLRFSANTTLES